jgi:hypothetical protein
LDHLYRQDEGVTIPAASVGPQTRALPRRLTDVLLGRRLPRTLQNALLLPVVAGVVATGAFALGSAASLWPDVIREHSRLAVRHWFAPVKVPVLIHWPVTIFWLGAMLWTGLTYLRLVADALENRSEVRRLEAAIYRAPSPTVVREYARYFSLAHEPIALWAATTLDPDDEISALGDVLRAVLRVVAGMALEFANAWPEDSFGANIMLAAPPASDPTQRFPRRLSERLAFVDRPSYSVTNLKTILYIPQVLIVSHLEGRRARTIPSIVLPVPQREADDGARIVMPGAPQAVLKGGASMHRDTAVFAEDCRALGDLVTQRVRTYFSPSGGGKDIGSFVSFLVGSLARPVAVLNIDANRKDLIGPDESYFETFYALIAPILLLLVDPADRFGQLTRERNIYIGDSRESSIV